MERVRGLLAQPGLCGLARDPVALVERDHQRAPGLLDHACDPGVLLGRSELGIDHQHDDVGTIELPDRHRHRDLLDLGLDLCFAADARRIDEYVVTPAEREWRVDGVRRGARRVVHQ